MGKRNGQTTAEYAVIIGVVVAAVVAMQVYVKRSLQGRVKDVTDYLTSKDGGTGTTAQYEPYYNVDSKYTVAQDDTSTDELLTGGKFQRTLVGRETKRVTDGYTKTSADESAD